MGHGLSVRACRKDGTEFWAAADWRPIYDGRGDPRQPATERRQPTRCSEVLSAGGWRSAGRRSCTTFCTSWPTA